MTSADDLLPASYLRRRGIRPQTEVSERDPRIARVRRGVYTASGLWENLEDAARYRMFVAATVSCMRTEQPLLCGLSAAAMWGLPVVGSWPGTVEVLGIRGVPGSSGNVTRRRVTHLPPACEVDGLHLTSASRTVVDVARSADFAAALTIADAALRTRLCTTDDLDAELAEVGSRARGRVAASHVVRLADGRSESPGESLSRARMWELGLPQPRLQLVLVDADGTYGRSDFGWPGVMGEFDGKLKYVSDEIAGTTSQDVVWREKLREDRIRRHSRVVRWTWDDALRGRAMARKLAEAGLRPDAHGQQWVRGDPNF